MRTRMSRNQRLVTLLEGYAQGEMDMEEFEDRRRELLGIDEEFEPESLAEEDGKGESEEDERGDSEGGRKDMEEEG